MSKVFFKEGLLKFKQTGAFTRSSKQLSRLMVKGMPTSNIKVIELGAGDGVITKEILAHLDSSNPLISYEINEAFLEDLNRINDPRLSIVCDCVTTLKSYPKNSVDYIVSSLPLANFSKEFKKQIFDAVKHVLKPNGEYIQYQYSLLDYKTLKSSFNDIDIGFCVRNIPPAFVYRCHEPKK